MRNSEVLEPDSVLEGLENNNNLELSGLLL